MKTILVTGATAGFGAAFARRLVADGHRVIATGRRTERLAGLAAELGENLLPVALDVTDKAAVAAFPESLPEAWRQIDVLINNAGLALGLSPAWDADLSDWDTMIATNITGLVHMTRAILPQMVERDDGIILNLGSVSGEYPYPDIEPGMVGGSEFSAVRFDGDEVRAAAVYAGITPLSPEDIAETAAWLISLPRHMNINRIEMMPTCQATAAFAVKRR